MMNHHPISRSNSHVRQRSSTKYVPPTMIPLLPVLLLVLTLLLVHLVDDVTHHDYYYSGVHGFSMIPTHPYPPTMVTTTIASLNAIDTTRMVQFHQFFRPNLICTATTRHHHQRQSLSSISTTTSSSSLYTLSQHGETSEIPPMHSTPTTDRTTTTTTTRTEISMTDAVFGIIKAMVGSGLLALSSGWAMVTNVPSHLYLAQGLLVVMGIVSYYTFLLYGQLVHATQAQTLGELWKIIYINNESNNESSSSSSINNNNHNNMKNETSTSSSSSFRFSDLTVSMATFIFCFGSCVAYSLTFGDMFSNFIRGLVGFCTTHHGHNTNTNMMGFDHPTVVASLSSILSNFLQSRQASILLLTGSIVLPLCRLSSLAALAPTSILGVIGILVTIGFLGVRCPAIVPTSPYGISSLGVVGPMLSNIIQQPSFSTFSRLQSPAPLIFIAMACVSYLAHFSAPDFYHSFVGPKKAPTTTISTNDNSITTRPIRRYTQMAIMGYTIVTLLNIFALTFGFLTFGGGCDGIILNNYNTIDIGAIVSRLLVGVSVIGSYPFVMSSCRNAALEIWNTLTPSSTSSASTTTTVIQKERRMTSILLGVITGIALFAKDAGFVIGFNGAVMGSTIAFTFPAMLFLKYHRPTATTTNKLSIISKFDVWACRGLIGFGVISSIVGGVTTIISSFAPHLLSSS